MCSAINIYVQQFFSNKHLENTYEMSFEVVRKFFSVTKTFGIRTHTNKQTKKEIVMLKEKTNKTPTLNRHNITI